MARPHRAKAGQAMLYKDHTVCRYAVQDLPCLFGGHEPYAVSVLGGHEPDLGDQASHADSEALINTETGDDDMAVGIVGTSRVYDI